jgi:DNA adenine methylase
VEPFGGTAAVLLAKRPAPFEVYNDLHGDLVNFYRVLREQPAELTRLCEGTPYARQEFKEARASYQDRAAWEALSELERARRWFVLCNQAYRPDGDDWGEGWKIKTKNPPSLMVARASALPAVAVRLRKVFIECRPWQEVVKLAQPGAVVYLDPPYGGAGRTNDYRHAAVDYVELADWCHEAAGRGLHVFVSGYPDSPYAAAFADWGRADLTGQRALSGAARVECLWSNTGARQLSIFEEGA